MFCSTVALVFASTSPATTAVSFLTTVENSAGKTRGRDTNTTNRWVGACKAERTTERRDGNVPTFRQ